MGLELVTRSTKASYEERVLMPIKGIDKALFPIVDTDRASSFLLDRYNSDPYGVTYRNPGNQSIVREYNPGTGELITPPRASEKTPIDESMSDLIVSGLEPTAAQAEQMVRMTDRITGDHIEAHNMTKFKQALDVIRTGVFSAKGIKGESLGLDITFTRDAGNSLTYDFTAGGATMLEALAAPQNQLKSHNASPMGQVVIMGQNWLNAFGADTGIQALREANGDNGLAKADMLPPQLQDVDGLFVLTVIRGPQMIAPMIICTYAPGTDYIAYKGASPAPWIPDDEAIFFSLSSKRYTINRGVDVLNEAGKKETVAGDIVFDSFTTFDPVCDYIRSQTRHCYVPANPNHTARSVGTFS